MDWYTLRVISGKEKKIRENILFELDTADLADNVENILVPTENVLEMKDGKKNSGVLMMKLLKLLKRDA